MRFWGCICLVITMFLWSSPDALAGQLSDRLEQFPQWTNKPPVRAARGDLVYPEWMDGTWEVTSTLVEQVAPLAPKIVTPGFEKNRSYLDLPVKFEVRFADQYLFSEISVRPLFFLPGKQPIVADRAFNGLEIARAYLGDNDVLSVKVDPNNPNRQITFLAGKRLLISTVTKRGTETPATDRFVATELAQQVFRGNSQIYINQVETTTAYQLEKPGKVVADQVTAIYLSPQDPDYFMATGRPAALYRYQLELTSIDEETVSNGEPK